MRSVRDLLRDYNFVNTAEGQRNTVRFFAGLLALAAGGFMVFFIAFGGGDDAGTIHNSGSPGEDPFEIKVEHLSGSQWYIGYDEQGYDPNQHDRYDPAAIETKIDQWEREYSISDKKPVTSGDEHDVLLGYEVTLPSLAGDGPVLPYLR